MHSSFRTLLGGATLSAAVALPTAAQEIREGARSSPKDAQISFGYLCDDRFVVRNEGDQPVSLEYGLAKNHERTALNLDGKESVELLLSSSDQLDLLSRGEVIASARREYRDCDELEESGRVVVRPLVIRSSPVIVIAPFPVYRSHYYPDYHHHHHVYYRPVVRPVVRAVVRIPIIIGRRSSDRGRDNDRDRDDRTSDRDRDTRSNNRFVVRPTGRINGTDNGRGNNGVGGGVGGGRDNNNGRGNGVGGGRDNNNGRGNGRDNNNGRRGR